MYLLTHQLSIWNTMDNQTLNKRNVCINENFGPFKLLAKNLKKRSAKINHRNFVLTNQKFGQTFMWPCSTFAQIDSKLNFYQIHLLFPKTFLASHFSMNLNVSRKVMQQSTIFTFLISVLTQQL